MKRLLACFSGLVSLLGLVLWSSSASAAVIKDGTDFSIDLGDSPICYIKPVSLRNAKDCEGLSPEAVDVEGPSHKGVLAMGLARLEETALGPVVAIIVVMRIDDYFGASGASDALARGYKSGAE